MKFFGLIEDGVVKNITVATDEAIDVEWMNTHAGGVWVDVPDQNSVFRGDGYISATGEFVRKPMDGHVYRWDVESSQWVIEDA